ncbi:hypothetical protein PanWU01x14_175870 [Parasponia andersonii]|uniref:Uncharacterized protein n=1 Tax=Parasponia andersonii TaxID=3476 RepID=A0A2P5C817_PARAD|nr:hypothetical protein PanWU01x14_175870 [Parasponia andersonii]
MATTASFPLYILSGITLMFTAVLDGKANGLTLKLIHCDSLDLPLFLSNLTSSERNLRWYNKPELERASSPLARSIQMLLAPVLTFKTPVSS